MTDLGKLRISYAQVSRQRLRLPVQSAQKADTYSLDHIIQIADYPHLRATP